MSYALTNYTSGKQRRKRNRKKIEITDSAGNKAPNVARRVAAEKASQVSITLVDAQRQNRQASKAWKAKARKFAFGTAIGLHAAALIILGVWFVKKTVLQMSEDKVQSVIVEEPPQQAKRSIAPRPSQKTTRPKAVEVLVPKTGAISPNTNLNLGPADFTMPVSELASDDGMQLNAIGSRRGMMEQVRQVEIVSAIPKFEMPKFENTGLTMKMEMGSSLATVDLNVSQDLGLGTANFEGTKQTFSEFLQKVRERIKEVQRFPPNVRNLEEGSSTTIRFTLLKDGTIRDPKVSISSGSRALDNAALAAVQNAEPYPPFPDGQAGSQIRLELPIVFQYIDTNLK